MVVRAHARTAEALLYLPDDGMRHELVRGELRVMVRPGAEHGRVAATVAGLLFVHTRETEAGITSAAETGFLLSRDPDTVRAPDAAFVASERAEAVGRTERYWPGAPDFVAEVLSPGDIFAEVEAKCAAQSALQGASCVRCRRGIFAPGPAVSARVLAGRRSGAAPPRRPAD